jgi:uncharacterized protein (DUF952 family)
LNLLFLQVSFARKLNFCRGVVVQNIFKILNMATYDTAEATGVFQGATIDLKDGFIHFSSVEQVRETARLHFAGGTDLMVLAVAAEALGPALKWERSRGGQLFPHLYGSLNMNAVIWAKPLPWSGEIHIFPPETFA